MKAARVALLSLLVVFGFASPPSALPLPSSAYRETRMMPLGAVTGGRHMKKRIRRSSIMKLVGVGLSFICSKSQHSILMPSIHPAGAEEGTFTGWSRVSLSPSVSSGVWSRSPRSTGTSRKELTFQHGMPKPSRSISPQAELEGIFFSASYSGPIAVKLLGFNFDVQIEISVSDEFQHLIQREKRLPRRQGPGKVECSRFYGDSPATVDISSSLLAPSASLPLLSFLSGTIRKIRISMERVSPGVFRIYPDLSHPKIKKVMSIFRLSEYEFLTKYEIVWDVKNDSVELKSPGLVSGTLSSKGVRT